MTSMFVYNIIRDTLHKVRLNDKHYHEIKSKQYKRIKINEMLTLLETIENIIGLMSKEQRNSYIEVTSEINKLIKFYRKEQEKNDWTHLI